MSDIFCVSFYLSQNAFSDRILNHTFLVFTKADSFLVDQAGSLNEYLPTLEGTFLWSLLEAMENRVMAVENKTKGYKRSLIRQTFLDLLRECVAERYTYKHFLQAQELYEDQLAKQAKKKEEDRKALHYQITKLAKQQIADENEEGLIRIIKTMPQDVVDRVSEKVKIEGMDPRDVADMANCITKTVLEDCAQGFLKERIKESLVQEIVDPERIASYDVEVMKRDYQVAIDIVSEEFFTTTVTETVGQLKVSCITQFLLANLELYDDPSEIERCLLRQYGAAFVSGDTINLMKECMDSDQVRACLPTFREKKKELEKLREKQQADDSMLANLQQQMRQSEQRMKQREQEMKNQMDQEREATERKMDAERKHHEEIRQHFEEQKAEKKRTEELIEQMNSENEKKMKELYSAIKGMGEIQQAPGGLTVQLPLPIPAKCVVQ